MKDSVTYNKTVALDGIYFDLKVTRVPNFRVYIEVFAKEYENDDTLHFGGSIKNKEEV